MTTLPLAADDPLPKKKPLYASLWAQVLVAIVVAIVFGHFSPSRAIAMKPLGDGFIKLITMIISLVIFCTVVSGIAGMQDIKKVGRVGGKALIYFEIVSTVALLVGMIIGNVLRPGDGLNVNPATLDAKAVSDYAGQAKAQNAPDFLLHIIPTTVVDAFGKGDILQVLFVSILFGLALSVVGPRGKFLADFFAALTHAVFAIVNIVMRFAPIGAFGAMAFTIGRYGFRSLASLGELMGCFYATCLVFIFGALGLVAQLHGFSIWRFVKYIGDELFIVLGTSSSESVLPRMIAKLQKMGAGKSVVGLVIPAGYSFNLDGTSIYLTMATLFIAQATNTPMDLLQQLTLLAVLLLTSKGAAGVTGSGFIVLAATLSTVGTLPVAGLALILGIDRFMSEARALTNVIGNGVATIVVAKWTGELDVVTMRRELGGERLPEPPTASA